MPARKQTIEMGVQYRTAVLERLAPQPDAATGTAAEERTFALTFSSETAEVERWWAGERVLEILGHSADEVDMTWLGTGRAPLLKDHNPFEQVGVIESASIDSRARVGRAVVRFGKGARAEEERQDVLDGIRTAISVGYVPEALAEVERADGVRAFRVKRWKPLEISTVSIPADEGVGLARSAGDGRTFTVPIIEKRSSAMSDPNTQAATPAEPTAKQPPQSAPAMDTAAIRSEAKRQADAMVAERQRDLGEILAIGKRWGMDDMAHKAISEGMPLDQFRQKVMAAKEADLEKGGKPATHLDMTPREVSQYSLLRAIRAAKANDWSKAGFERDASLAISERLGRSPNGFFVPADAWTKRELTAGASNAGAELVGTDHRDDMFIEMLRPRMLTARMGATMLTGLVGNVSIPRQTGGATFAWIAESADVSESTQATDNVALSPKTGAARTIISRLLLAQSSPSAEAMVMEDLRKISALGLDLAAINGSGASNQPRGILNVSGIGSVAGGTNGAAPTWANIVDLVTAVAQDDADMGSLGYLTNAKVRGKLQQTEKATGTAQFIWGDQTDADGFGGLNGYRAGVSNQVPSNLTKGTSTSVCSAIIYGNFADLIIASWGVLDVQVTGNTRADGGTDIRVFQDVDIVVRHPESFAAMKDALTA